MLNCGLVRSGDGGVQPDVQGEHSTTPQVSTKKRFYTLFISIILCSDVDPVGFAFNWVRGREKTELDRRELYFSI